MPDIYFKENNTNNFYKLTELPNGTLQATPQRLDTSTNTLVDNGNPVPLSPLVRKTGSHVDQNGQLINAETTILRNIGFGQIQPTLKSIDISNPFPVTQHNYRFEIKFDQNGDMHLNAVNTPAGPLSGPRFETSCWQTNTGNPNIYIFWDKKPVQGTPGMTGELVRATKHEGQPYTFEVYNPLLNPSDWVAVGTHVATKNHYTSAIESHLNSDKTFKEIAVQNPTNGASYFAPFNYNSSTINDAVDKLLKPIDEGLKAIKENKVEIDKALSDLKQTNIFTSDNNKIRNEREALSGKLSRFEKRIFNRLGKLRAYERLLTQAIHEVGVRDNETTDNFITRLTNPPPTIDGAKAQELRDQLNRLNNNLNEVKKRIGYAEDTLREIQEISNLITLKRKEEEKRMLEMSFPNVPSPPYNPFTPTPNVFSPILKKSGVYVMTPAQLTQFKAETESYLDARKSASPGNSLNAATGISFFHGTTTVNSPIAGTDNTIIRTMGDHYSYIEQTKDQVAVRNIGALLKEAEAKDEKNELVKYGPLILAIAEAVRVQQQATNGAPLSYSGANPKIEEILFKVGVAMTGNPPQGGSFIGSTNRVAKKGNILTSDETIDDYADPDNNKLSVRTVKNFLIQNGYIQRAGSTKSIDEATQTIIQQAYQPAPTPRQP